MVPTYLIIMYIRVMTDHCVHVQYTYIHNNVSRNVSFVNHFLYSFTNTKAKPLLIDSNILNKSCSAEFMNFIPLEDLHVYSTKTHNCTIRLCLINKYLSKYVVFVYIICTYIHTYVYILSYCM